MSAIAQVGIKKKKKRALGTVQRMTNIPVRFWKICHSDLGVCLFLSMRRQVRGLPWLPGVGVEFQ